MENWGRTLEYIIIPDLDSRNDDLSSAFGFTERSAGKAGDFATKSQRVRLVLGVMP